MKQSVRSNATLEWVDILNPSEEELHQVAKIYGLHELHVQDCLDPHHLPKFEKMDSDSFIMLRVHDVHAKRGAVTVQGLTRKIAVFFSEHRVVTIHRAELPFLEELSQNSIEDFLLDLSTRAVLSYEIPLEKAENELEQLESRILVHHSSSKQLLLLHQLRRRLGNLKRLLWHTATIVQRMPFPKSAISQKSHDLKETVDSVLFFADELLDDSTSLLNLELSLASHRTNEVVRVLTLFSAFFLPLTFIVGIYGMNFEHLPEIKWRWGYGYAWLLMAGVTLGITFWFKKKGWLKA